MRLTSMELSEETRSVMKEFAAGVERTANEFVKSIYTGVAKSDRNANIRRKRPLGSKNGYRILDHIITHSSEPELNRLGGIRKERALWAAIISLLKKKAKKYEFLHPINPAIQDIRNINPYRANPLFLNTLEANITAYNPSTRNDLKLRNDDVKLKDSVLRFCDLYKSFPPNPAAPLYAFDYSGSYYRTFYVGVVNDDNIAVTQGLLAQVLIQLLYEKSSDFIEKSILKGEKGHALDSGVSNNLLKVLQEEGRWASFLGWVTTSLTVFSFCFRNATFLKNLKTKNTPNNYLRAVYLSLQKKELGSGKAPLESVENIARKVALIRNKYTNELKKIENQSYFERGRSSVPGLIIGAITLIAQQIMNPGLSRDSSDFTLFIALYAFAIGSAIFLPLLGGIKDASKVSGYKGTVNKSILIQGLIKEELGKKAHLSQTKGLGFFAEKDRICSHPRSPFVDSIKARNESSSLIDHYVEANFDETDSLMMATV